MKIKEHFDYYGKFPDNLGHFGEFGGRYVPELLIPILEELENSFNILYDSEEFQQELSSLYQNYAGRPTPLYFCERISEEFNCKVYFKREDLVHGGAHKLNNTLGQALLAAKMGKKRLIAETGAGQHGFATAIAGAKLGLKTEVYMGAKDVERQQLNVLRMKLLGAKVIPVHSGSQTLKDSINDALRDWITNIQNTFYVIGSVVGPHPYPIIVREFQRVIGKEIKNQIMKIEGRLPDAIIACIGGGSNAMGAFYDFIEDGSVELIGVEAGGKGLEGNKHGASLFAGTKGILHGSLTYILQDSFGQINESHSISAGLDYPGVGPEHALLEELGRLKLGSILDEEAIEALKFCSTLEGIIPALESSHAIAYAMKTSHLYDKDDIIIINLSGSGSKDLGIIQAYL